MVADADLDNVNPFALASGSDDDAGEPADGYAEEGAPAGAVLLSTQGSKKLGSRLLIASLACC